MKRRLLCGILAAIMLLTLVSGIVIHVSAASSLSASEDCIAVLKNMEGFVAKPYYDHGQYTVGYGTACGQYDYPNGITEAQADALLRKFVKTFETHVNRFADKNGLTFTQNEFDALILFTYNVGAGWLTSTSDLRDSVIRGDRGNDFIYYLSRWSTANYEIMPALVKRRLAEADTYLNGVYSVFAPSHFSYVLFNSNGGDCVSRVQGYDASEPGKVIPTPVHEDSNYRFLGWYTEQEGGKWVTHLDTTTAEKTLYAHWQTSDQPEGSVNYQRKIRSGDPIAVHAEPGSRHIIGTVNAGETVTIAQDFLDGAKVKWGQLSTGGWIQLSNTEAILVPAEKPVRESVTVTVTNSYVNVRKGPGTSYARVGSVSIGEELKITETKVVNGSKWGKFSGGWLSLMYTNYDSVLESTNNSDETVIASGTVSCSGYLNIRSGAGVNYGLAGSLNSGTKVSIYEKKTVAGHEWGRINSGWICLDYVIMDAEPAPGPAEPTDPTPSEPQPTDPAPIDPAPTDPAPGAPDSGNQDEEKEPETDKDNTPKTGTVINCTELNVRSAPGAHNTRVGGLLKGTKVEILEETVYNGMPWGRTSMGWISMHYIRVDYKNTGDYVTGSVYNCNALNVRSAPGANNRLVGQIPVGTRVEIYEQVIVSGQSWGRSQQGWICLSYVRLETITESGIRFTGTVNTNGLRIRSAAGVHNAILGFYNTGNRVDILETTTVNGVIWGRTNKGWICLQYVNW